MAMNGVMLLLSIVMTILYSAVMDRVSKKIGGIQGKNIVSWGWSFPPPFLASSSPWC